MDIKQTYESLGTYDNLIKIALIAGVVHTLTCSSFLNHPLSSMCIALIVAIIYSFFATIVMDIAPEFLRPLVSIVLIMSIVYYLLFKKCHESKYYIDQDGIKIKYDEDI